MGMVDIGAKRTVVKAMYRKGGFRYGLSVFKGIVLDIRLFILRDITSDKKRIIEAVYRNRGCLQKTRQ